MTSRLEDLWAEAGHDGATTPPGSCCGVLEAEIEELLAAWSDERSGRIEANLLLDRAYRLLVKMLADDRLTPCRRRQVRLLSRTIQALRDRPS